MGGDTMADDRASMVRRLRSTGYVRSPEVEEALEAVPREAFLEPPMRPHAYEDQPLPIGGRQTISAPHMVAIMCEALELRPGLRVLEVGGGSGYHAAVVARLVDPGLVLSIEFDPELAERAKRTVERLGIRNLRIRQGDGAHGAPQDAPFDRVYLACTAPAFPQPLLEQVAPGGMILGPVGEEGTRLLRRRRTKEGWQEDDLGPCSFVPLRGGFGATRPFDK